MPFVDETAPSVAGGVFVDDAPQGGAFVEDEVKAEKTAGVPGPTFTPLGYSLPGKDHSAPDDAGLLTKLGVGPEQMPTGQELMEGTKLGVLNQSPFTPVTAYPVSAAAKSITGVADWMTSPSGGAQMIAAMTPGLDVVMAGKFAKDMIHGGYVSAKDIGEGLATGDWQKVSEGAANFLLSVFGTKAVVAHGVKAGKTYWDNAQQKFIPVGQGIELPSSSESQGPGTPLSITTSAAPVSAPAVEAIAEYNGHQYEMVDGRWRVKGETEPLPEGDSKNYSDKEDRRRGEFLDQLDERATPPLPEGKPPPNTRAAPIAPLTGQARMAARLNQIEQATPEPRPAITVADVEKLSDEEVSKLAAEKRPDGGTVLDHAAGIEHGLTLQLEDAEALRTKYKLAMRAMVEATKKEDEIAQKANFARANFYKGAFQGAERKGPEYEAYLKKKGAELTNEKTQGQAEGTLTEATGLGGATPEEVAPAGTALKNAVGELERVSHGLPAQYPAQRRSMAEAWIRSGESVAKDPLAGQKLADELKHNPERGMTDDDSALLLRHKVELENAKNQAASDTITATTPEAKAEAQARFDGLSNELLDLLDAAKFRGSQWGREGRWRQALAFEDYSLETMRRDKQLSVDRKLTPQEETQIKTLHDRIADLERQLAEKQTSITNSQRASTANETISETGTQTKADVTTEKAAGIERDLAAEQVAAVDHLKERFGEQGDLTGANPTIKKLMELLYRQGITERIPLEDAIHKILKDQVDPTITIEETQDLMSGYGKYKEPSKDPIKAGVREVAGQILQVRKMIDLVKQGFAKPTGFLRQAAGPIQRNLIKAVNEIKKKYGVPQDAAKALQSALDTVNKRLTNRLMDLKQEVANRQKIIRTRNPSPYNEETLRLQKEIEEVKKEHAEIFPKEPLTPEQRLARLEASSERQIKELERQIKTGEIFQKGKSEPGLNSDRLAAAKARIEALKSERDALRETIQPSPEPEMVHLQQILNRLRNREADYLDRLAKGDFEKKVRKAQPENDAIRNLKARVEEAKLEFRRGMEKDRLSKRSWPEKVADFISTWKRASVLAWPTTFAKLTAAAAEGLLIAPSESVGNALWAKLLPRSVGEKSARYGGPLNIGAEKSAIADTVVNLVKNFKQAAKTGNIDIDLAHGKPSILPQEMSGWLGALHYAFKTPLMQNEWSRSFKILMDEAARKGVDTTDAGVIQRLGNQAYRFAEERLFLEDNRVVSMYNRMLQAARQADKDTGKSTFTGKAIETALRYEFPIVRIPTNLVKRTFEYSFGTFTGSTRLARAFINGVDNLPPAEADAIIRNLTRGTLGTAMLLYGFFNPNQIGGYYQEGKKRDPKDVQYGDIKINGVNVPKLVLHHPLLEQLQIGATMRRVADSKLRKKDPEAQGLGAGAWAALMGLIDETPFVREIKDTIESTKDKDAFFGELGKSAIPGVVQWAAGRTDIQPGTGNFFTGESVKRRPTNIVQHIEMGIPELRKNVPIKLTK